MAAVVRVVHHAGAVPRLWRRTIHALFESADPPATQSAVPGAPGHELRAIRVGALWHNPGTSQLVRARAQLLGADATRPPLADSLKCHLSTTPGESDRLANFSSVPTFVIQHHDQTVSLVGTHRRRGRRPHPRLQFRGTGDLIRTMPGHELSVERPGRYGRHNKRGAASIAAPPDPVARAPRSHCKTWRLATAQFRMAHRPSPPRSWHRLGPVDMPFEAKRFRHVAVAIPIVAIRGVVAVSPRQQCAQPQQPDVAYHQTFIGWRGR